MCCLRLRVECRFRKSFDWCFYQRIKIFKKICYRYTTGSRQPTDFQLGDFLNFFFLRLNFLQSGFVIELKEPKRLVVNFAFSNNVRDVWCDSYQDDICDLKNETGMMGNRKIKWSPQDSRKESWICCQLEEYVILLDGGTFVNI